MTDRFEGSVRTVAWLAMLAILVTTGTARADDDETSKIVRHKVVVDCDADDADCKDRVHKIVVRTGDGEGEENVWVSAGGEKGMMPKIHLGDGGFAFHGPNDGGGFLGVGLSEMTPELRRHFGAPENAGVLVSKVVDGSPAAAAGVAVGDVITRVDGEEVASGHQLAHSIRSKEAGETASLEVWRDGKIESLSAVIEEHEGPGPMRMRIAGHEGDGPIAKRVVVCEGDGDCEGAHGMAFIGSDCPEGESCEVEVRCDGDDCECTINGESTDCSAVRGE